MANENAVQDEQEFINNDSLESFDLDELEATLQGQLEEELSDLAFLQEEQKQIGSPDALGETIKNVVWEQFINQIATTAGEDFIKENNGLHLDLRKEAHIQTTENFAEGKIATHNTEINYQERYDNWQSNFVKDEKGNVVTHQTRTGKEEATLAKGARADFDKDRPSGSAERHTDMDHTVSAAEIIRDPAANAHMTKEEQIAFANSDANLNEMDSSLNRSKGDKSMTDWLDTPNANGQKPDEIFDISAEDDAKMRQKDAEAREEYERQKAEAEKRSIEAGKKSRKEEAFRIGGKALRAVVMQLLAELMKEIISKLVKWLKSAAKKLETLLSALKEAITAFVGKLKTHLMNAADTAFTTIATAIFGPVINTVKKVWTFLKQGWKSLMDAVAYIRNPENKGKPVGILLLEVGKIVTAGLTAAGAIVLSEVIEKALIAIPGVGAVFAFEIPLLGSLANLLGIFLGGVVAGIIGAIVINLLQKQIDKSKKSNLTEESIKKGNEILNLQYQAQILGEALLERDKDEVQSNISGRHQAASVIMRDAYGNIMEDFVVDFSNIVNTPSMDEEDLAINKEIDKANSALDDLLSALN